MHKSVDGTVFMHVSDCSRTQKMCNKAIEQDSKSVSDYFKTPEICKKDVKKPLFAIIHVPDQHKTQQMCEKNI